MDTDKKLELIRSIRNTHQHNKTLLHSREQLLYGGDTASLLKKGEIYGTEDMAAESAPVAQTPALSSFKLRLFVAIMIFCAFLICDKSGYGIFGLTMDDVATQITKESEELSDLSIKVLDFF